MSCISFTSLYIRMYLTTYGFNNMFYIFAAFLGLAVAQSCDESNCQPPDCRCYSATTTPGGLALDEIPQIVIISMDYSLNEEYSVLYDQLFPSGLTNPNGCPLTASYFSFNTGTKMDIVKSYYDRGFEIGIQAWNETRPTDSTAWFEMIQAVKNSLIDENIAAESILGYKALELEVGGDDQFIAMADNGLKYDASCVNPEAPEKWPFTYDLIDPAVKCNSGDVPSVPYPGIWQFLLPEYIYKDQRCGSPEACTEVITTQDAFDFMYNNFDRHQAGSRTPYFVTIEPSWAKEANKLTGTAQFIEYIRQFEDVWIVTGSQALEWIQDPTPLTDINNFAPWQC